MTDPIKPATDEELDPETFPELLNQRVLLARIEADRVIIAARDAELTEALKALAAMEHYGAEARSEIDRLNEQQFCQFCGRLEGPR